MLAEKESFPELSTLPVFPWIKMPGNKTLDYYKLEFDNIRALNEFRTNHTDRAHKLYYNSFNEQIYISNEDWVLQYPNSNALKIMFWDIEVKTIGDGIFPRALTAPILCIGYSIWEYHSNGTRVKVKQEIIKDFTPEIEDLIILENFTKAIQENDPDIIAGYNSELFDFPYLYERAHIKNVPLLIGRNGREPSISINGTVHINGRIHYDMYKKVEKDQTLFGLKSRTLKVMARHYDCPLTKEQDLELDNDIKNTYNLFLNNPTRLYTYQDADIIRTEHVGAVYIRNDITLAERVKVPLNNTMNTYSSFIPKLFVGRNEWKRNLICTETNFNKYNKENGSLAKLGSKYEGALVGLYKTGYFKKIRKLDFKSMYPSAACTFNLGPDTTELVDVKPYTGKYKFFRDDKYNWYRIPDRNFNVDLIIKVRNDIEGFLKKEIKDLWDERAKVKKELKEAQATDQKELIAALNSQQVAIKVILNCFHPDTTILTNTGIKLLKDVKVGELVWSINPNTFKAELKPVEKTYEYEIVDQDLYVINHQRFSQIVTEGHKMLGFRNGRCFFEEAKDFTKHGSIEIPNHLLDSNNNPTIYSNNIILKKENTSIIKYTGKVYSLTVKDNHTVYAGIDGKMGWIGQSIYGMMGLKSTTYGDMITAIMITGMCRWTTTKVIMKYKDKLVELDTDGIALDDYVSEEETNKWLDEIILENFGITENYMQMELEEFEDAYFYAMKNYVVREGNEFIIHGSSLKSSRACKVIDRATNLAIEHIFNSKPIEEVIHEAYNFSKCKIEDFTYRLKLSKSKNSYDDKTGQVLFLAAQVEMATKQEVTEGLQMEYVVTKNQRPEKELQAFYNRKTQGHNYTYVDLVKDVKEIDTTYYTEAIDKVLERFRIRRIVQENLFGDTFTNTELNVVPTEI